MYILVRSDPPFIYRSNGSLSSAQVTYYVVKEGDKRASTVTEEESLPSVLSSAEDIAFPFVVRHRGKLLGLRVGRLHPRVHDPYRCNGGGVKDTNE